jgi:hypothetical protein
MDGLIKARIQTYSILGQIQGEFRFYSYQKCWEGAGNGCRGGIVTGRKGGFGTGEANTPQQEGPIIGPMTYLHGVKHSKVLHHLFTISQN